MNTDGRDTANHFYRYAPTKIDYAITRYQTESKRLYRVLNDRLAAQDKAGKGLWLVGGKYTIADLCCFSWVNWAEWAGIPKEPFPEVQKWYVCLTTLFKFLHHGCERRY